MKPENVLLKQQGRSGIKVGIFPSLCLLPVSQPRETNRGLYSWQAKAEEITFIRPPEFRAWPPP